MTGHAWPLTQGDSKTRCRKSKVHERHDTHSIRQSGPVRKRAANRRLVPKVTGGQLRLSLTNTYHEWPVILRYSRIGGSLCEVGERYPSMIRTCQGKTHISS